MCKCREGKGLQWIRVRLLTTRVIFNLTTSITFITTITAAAAVSNRAKNSINTILTILILSNC